MPVNWKLCCLPYKLENEEERCNIHRKIATKSKNSVINKTLKVSSKQNKPVSLHYSKNYECYDKPLKDVNERKTLKEKKEII